MAHGEQGREVLMLDTESDGVWPAVVETLEFIRLKMINSPYFSETTNFEGKLGILLHNYH